MGKKKEDNTDLDQELEGLFARVRMLSNEDKKNFVDRIGRVLTSGERGQKLCDVIANLNEVINRDCSEEEVQGFIADNEIILTDRYGAFNDRCIAGVIPKFPITPDRIVDFLCFEYRIGPHQGYTNEIKIVEIKRPQAKIFSQHGRMSQDLNDGWMECTEALRLILLNYKDVLRRSSKSAEAKARFSPFGSHGSTHDCRVVLTPPFVRAEVYVGRRSSLTQDGLDRLRALMIGGSISAFSYDHLVDHLMDINERSAFLF